MCGPAFTLPEAGADLRGGEDPGRATKGDRVVSGVWLGSCRIVLSLQVGGSSLEATEKRLRGVRGVPEKRPGLVTPSAGDSPGGKAL